MSVGVVLPVVIKRIASRLYEPTRQFLMKDEAHQTVDNFLESIYVDLVNESSLNASSREVTRTIESNLREAEIHDPVRAEIMVRPLNYSRMFPIINEGSREFIVEEIGENNQSWRSQYSNLFEALAEHYDNLLHMFLAFEENPDYIAELDISAEESKELYDVFKALFRSVDGKFKRIKLSEEAQDVRELIWHHKSMCGDIAEQFKLLPQIKFLSGLKIY